MVGRRGTAAGGGGVRVAEGVDGVEAVWGYTLRTDWGIKKATQAGCFLIVGDVVIVLGSAWWWCHAER